MTERKKTGRKPHDPTQPVTVDPRQTVETLAGFGISQDDIGLYLGIDPKTLRKNYRVELDRGAVMANAKVAQSLYLAATATDEKGNLRCRNAVTAQIFWLKTRAGWNEFPLPKAPTKPDAQPRPPKLGKKEQADAEALKDDPSWLDLLPN